MKVGLHTFLYPARSLHNSVCQLLRLNVECLEIVCDLPHKMPQDFDSKALKDISDLVGSHVNVAVHAPVGGVDLSSPYEPIRKHSMETICKCVDIAEYLGSHVVTLHPPPPPPRFFAEREFGIIASQFVSSIHRCARHARNKGVFLCLENMPGASQLYYQWLRIMLDKEPDVSRITFDIGHSFITENQETLSYAVGLPVERFVGLRIRELQKSIVHVHLHDNDGNSDLHLPLNYGRMNVGLVLKAIKDIGYDDLVILEVVDPRKAEPSDSLVLDWIQTARDWINA
jgi:sugar phosphate isomerase/epimerase